MEKFFSKIGSFTDIHFGLDGDSREHNERCVAFISWFIQECRTRGVTKAIFMGDWHHNRDKVGVGTLNYSKDGLDLMYAADDIEWWFLLGNHDLYFRNNRSMHSLPFMDTARINLVTEPTLVDDCLLVPWLVPEDDLTEIVRLAKNAKYVFGHFEFGGFLMNETAEQIYREGHLKAEDITGPEIVFSGHFHKRQRKTINGLDFWYAGNCFPHDFNDANDRDRGMMVLEHGGQPEFLSWPDQPTFDRVGMEEVLRKIDEGEVDDLLRSTLQIHDDMDLSNEDREAVLEVLGEVGVPKATIKKSSKEEVELLNIAPTATVIAVLTDYLVNSEDVPDDYDRGELVDILEEAA